MDVRFSIALPREAYTVSVMRGFMGEALRTSGLCDECLSDLLMASSEACANVIDHGHPAPSYEVFAQVCGGWCVLEITNTGPGFDPEDIPDPDPEAESGRGILLMRRLVDEVEFGRAPGGGTLVRLSRRLHAPPAAGTDGPRSRTAVL